MLTVTTECAELAFGVVNFGDHHVNAGVRDLSRGADLEAVAGQVQAAFNRDDLHEVLRVFDQHFNGTPYSLRSLFRDQQRRILNLLLTSTLERAEADYRHVYDDCAALMRFVGDLGMPQPKIFHVTAEFVINAEMRRAFEREDLDLVRVAMLLEAARRDGVILDGSGLGYALQHSLERAMGRLLVRPELTAVRKMNAAIDLTRMLPFEVNLWRIQNDCYRGLQQQKVNASTELLREWEALARKLGIAPEAVDHVAPEETQSEPAQLVA